MQNLTSNYEKGTLTYTVGISLALAELKSNCVAISTRFQYTTHMHAGKLSMKNKLYNCDHKAQPTKFITHACLHLSILGNVIHWYGGLSIIENYSSSQYRSSYANIKWKYHSFFFFWTQFMQKTQPLGYALSDFILQTFGLSFFHLLKFSCLYYLEIHHQIFWFPHTGAFSSLYTYYAMPTWKPQ